MSLARCTNCGHIVDTDHDGEFYFLKDKVTTGFCENCRDADRI